MAQDPLAEHTLADPKPGESAQAHNLAPTAAEAWPFYDEDEIAATVAVLRSGKVNQWTGDRVWAFQQAYADHVGTGQAIAVANGSVALELALHGFGIGPGDEVIVTPRTFVASVFCVMLAGATPVFADVDRDSGNVTAATIEAAITPRTKAAIPVHLGGWPADMPAIMALAERRGFKVIEDCAQAHGAEIGGRPAGSFGDAAAFSFCQDKIISTGGEGGLVLFRDAEAHDRAWSFKDHGKNRRRMMTPAAGPGFRWVHDAVGTNMRMTEIAAAIGLIQLGKLQRWRALRTRNAGIWAEALAPIPGLRTPRPGPGLTGAFYKYYAYIDPARADGADNEELRNAILAEAAAKGLRIFSGSCSEVYREAALSHLQVPTLPAARALGQASLMFEVHPTLDPDRLRDRAAAAADIIERILA
ncbi:DegT/DnrJ/EryC1/StrS family aminotransferase [Sphingosinicella rhizophila]|uniref:DegT/DnrJ/EryC1/StrS family aminotransferase n=1 Tax=Sphingosinicella rhizophila TaxID=3050082 RepID=A0ABU3Q679_9SPHN|nr:DegT/DnrJ/EryC1/StrS family aminotransferase [Sphingosinicella sp. GR2756]MDT9598910.1 DegT/DnrJ/EryC1/StrS family aminotransferase [Sphingosinicella sp. GR2756]